MDRLRQSIRKSFRRRDSSSKMQTALTPTTSTTPAVGSNSSFRKEKNLLRSTTKTTIPIQQQKTTKTCGNKEKDYCQIDEAAVRSAACCFMVKVGIYYYFR